MEDDETVWAPDYRGTAPSIHQEPPPTGAQPHAREAHYSGERATLVEIMGGDGHSAKVSQERGLAVVRKSDALTGMYL